MVSPLTYSKGFVYLQESQGFFLPTNTFLLMIREVARRESDEFFQQILFESTKRDALFLAYLQRNEKSTTASLNYFLSFINSLGFGEVVVQRRTSKRITFFQERPYLTLMYKSLFQETPPVLIEEIFRGFLGYFLSAREGKVVEVSSVQKSGSVYYDCVISDKQFNDQLEDIYDSKRPAPVNNLVRNVAINDHIKINKGLMTMWNLGAVFLPAHFVLSFVSELDFSYDDFFSDYGYMQGKWALELQRSAFGVKDPNLLFDQVAKQTDLVGFGPFRYELLENGAQFNLYENISTYFSTWYSGESTRKFVLFMLSILQASHDYSFRFRTDLGLTPVACMLTKNSIDMESLTQRQLELSSVLNSKVLLKKRFF